MTELFPLKSAINYLYYIDVLLIIIVLFLTLHYFVLVKLFLEPRKKMKKARKIRKIIKKLPKKVQKPIKEIILEKLDNLELEKDRWEFFVEFNEILREYFASSWIKNAEHKNLSELEKEAINMEILEIFRQSYYMIFNEKLEDNLEFRQDILEKAKIYFTNKV